MKDSDAVGVGHGFGDDDKVDVAVYRTIIQKKMGIQDENVAS